MTTKKSKILAAMSEHRYRTAREIADRTGLASTAISAYLSDLYHLGEVDRDNHSKPYRYILRNHKLSLRESLTESERLTLCALVRHGEMTIRCKIPGMRGVKTHLARLARKGGARRKRAGVYAPTKQGVEFVKSLDAQAPKQQPLPVPKPAPTQEPEREPVPWHIPIQPPTVVERPQYTSAALIVAAAAIIIAIIVTGCIQ